MPDEIAPVVASVEAPAAPTMDMDAAVADIADSLNLGDPPADDKEVSVVDDAGKQEAKALDVEEKKEAAPLVVDPKDVAPDTWRPAAKEKWAAVPSEVKEELRKREQDIASYVDRVKQPVAIGQKLNEIVAPHLEYFNRAGVDVFANIRDMFEAQKQLLFGTPETKLAMVQRLAEMAGVKLADGVATQAPDSVARYIQQLEAKVNSLQSGVHEVTSTVQRARSQELEGHILAFANDTTAHPYFADVAGAIPDLIKTGAAKTLEDAYNLAVNMNPVTRQKSIESEAGRLAARNATAAAERAKKAATAASANVRSTAGRRAAPQTGSIDDTLKDALAEINSRTH